MNMYFQVKLFYKVINITLTWISLISLYQAIPTSILCQSNDQNYVSMTTSKGRGTSQSPKNNTHGKGKGKSLGKVDDYFDNKWGTPP